MRGRIYSAGRVDRRMVAARRATCHDSRAAELTALHFTPIRCAGFMAELRVRHDAGRSLKGKMSARRCFHSSAAAGGALADARRLFTAFNSRRAAAGSEPA